MSDAEEDNARLRHSLRRNLSLTAQLSAKPPTLASTDLSSTPSQHPSISHTNQLNLPCLVYNLHTCTAHQAPLYDTTITHKTKEAAATSTEPTVLVSSKEAEEMSPFISTTSVAVAGTLTLLAFAFRHVHSS